MPRNERPSSLPVVQASRWFGDLVRQLGLLSPLLATAGIVWLAWGLYGTNDFHAVPTVEIQRLIMPAGSSRSDATTAAVREYAAHLAWNTLAGLYLVFFVATLLLGIWIISRVLEATPRCGVTGRWQWIALLAILFAVASWYVLHHIGYGVISAALLKSTVFAQAPDLPARQQFFSSGGQITALFLAALSSLILPSPGCADERCLRNRIGLLRLVLGAGTVLLVVDVMRENALLRWALGFVDPSNKTAAHTLQSLASTIVAGRGVLGTVLLAAIYLPAASILRGQVWATVPVTIATIPEATRWLQDRGLIAPSSVAQLRPIVAVLLPLLTGVFSGPAADVLRNLTKP
jgi:hypothetical protein